MIVGAEILRKMPSKSEAHGLGPRKGTHAKPASPVKEPHGECAPRATQRQTSMGAQESDPDKELSKKGKDLARLNQAISQAVKAENYEEAERLFTQILKCGLQPDSISFNSLIHACAK